VVFERGRRLGVDVAGRNTLAPTARQGDVKHHILKCLILKVRWFLNWGGDCGWMYEHHNRDRFAGGRHVKQNMYTFRPLALIGVGNPQHQRDRRCRSISCRWLSGSTTFQVDHFPTSMFLHTWIMFLYVSWAHRVSLITANHHPGGWDVLSSWVDQ